MTMNDNSHDTQTTTTVAPSAMNNTSQSSSSASRRHKSPPHDDSKEAASSSADTVTEEQQTRRIRPRRSRRAAAAGTVTVPLPTSVQSPSPSPSPEAARVPANKRQRARRTRQMQTQTLSADAPALPANTLAANVQPIPPPSLSPPQPQVPTSASAFTASADEALKQRIRTRSDGAVPSGEPRRRRTLVYKAVTKPADSPNEEKREKEDDKERATTTTTTAQNSAVQQRHNRGAQRTHHSNGSSNDTKQQISAQATSSAHDTITNSSSLTSALPSSSDKSTSSNHPRRPPMIHNRPSRAWTETGKAAQTQSTALHSPTNSSSTPAAATSSIPTTQWVPKRDTSISNAAAANEQPTTPITAESPMRDVRGARVQIMSTKKHRNSSNKPAATVTTQVSQPAHTVKLMSPSSVVNNALKPKHVVKVLTNVTPIESSKTTTTTPPASRPSTNDSQTVASQPSSNTSSPSNVNRMNVKAKTFAMPMSVGSSQQSSPSLSPALTAQQLTPLSNVIEPMNMSANPPTQPLSSELEEYVKLTFADILQPKQITQNFNATNDQSAPLSFPSDVDSNYLSLTTTTPNTPMTSDTPDVAQQDEHDGQSNNGDQLSGLPQGGYHEAQPPLTQTTPLMHSQSFTPAHVSHFDPFLAYNAHFMPAHSPIPSPDSAYFMHQMEDAVHNVNVGMNNMSIMGMPPPIGHYSLHSSPNQSPMAFPMASPFAPSPFTFDANNVPMAHPTAVQLAAFAQYSGQQQHMIRQHSAPPMPMNGAPPQTPPNTLLTHMNVPMQMQMPVIQHNQWRFPPEQQHRQQHPEQMPPHHDVNVQHMSPHQHPHSHPAYHHHPPNNQQSPVHMYHKPAHFQHSPHQMQQHSPMPQQHDNGQTNDAYEHQQHHDGNYHSYQQ